MTDELSTLGKRIAYYRKRRGIATAKELATIIDSPKVTEAVIQNIESGRKTDPSISQLLNIARGIGVAPVMLLTRMEHPYDPIDLPNLSPAFERKLNWEFDAWFSATGKIEIGDMPAASYRDQIILDDIRGLVVQLDYWRDSMNEPRPTKGDLDDRRLIEARIDRYVKDLEGQIDMPWLNRPWLPSAETSAND